MSNYHHLNLKEELIEKGLEMIKNDGVESMSLRKLAKACGVSEAAPYSHFKNKEDLLNEMSIYVNDKLYNRIVEIYESCPDKDEPRSIFEIGKQCVLFFANHPTYYSFVFNQSNLVLDLSMKGKEDYKPFMFFRDICMHVYKKQGYSEERIKYGIINMWSLVQGLSAIASMKNVRRDFEWEEEIERIFMG